MGLKVKPELYIGGVGILHEVYLRTLRDRVRVYGMRKGPRICVGAWVQCFFTFIVVDDAHLRTHMTSSINVIV